MKTRIITAAILLPLLLIIILALPKLVTADVFGVLCAISAWELLNGTGLVKHPRLQIYAMVSGFLVGIWSGIGAPYSWGLLWVLVFVSVLFGELMMAHSKLRIEKLCITMVAGLLIPFLLTSLVRIHGQSNGRYLILLPVVIAFISDSCAYFVGLAVGKHKLAPVISPKKTVEGLVGGLIGGIAGVALYCLILDLAFGFTVHYGFVVVYGLAGSLAAVFGDLCFSVIKRQTGIKDYGNLIPGHGGVLDRFDSMLTVGPLVEVLMILIPVAVK